MQTDRCLKIQEPQPSTQSGPAKISIRSCHFSAQILLLLLVANPKIPTVAQQVMSTLSQFIPYLRSSCTGYSLFCYNWPYCNSNIPKGLLLGIFTVNLPSACYAFPQKFIILSSKTSSKRPFLSFCLKLSKSEGFIQCIPPPLQLAQCVAQQI